MPTTGGAAAAAGDAVYIVSIPQYPERPVVGVLDWSCRPGLPRAVGELPVEFSDVSAMTVTDQSLWVNAGLFEGAFSLHRFDISTPTQPTYMGSIVGSSSRAVESGGLLFALGRPVAIIDPTIRDSIAVIGTIEVEESVQDLAHVPSFALPSWAFFDLLIDGSILHAAGMGIQSFDISNPASPAPLTYLPFTGYVSVPSYAQVEAGGRNFVVTMTDDFSKPETPRVVHKMILEEGEGQYQQMTVDGDWLYTAPAVMEDPLPSLHVLRIDAGGALREVARHQLFAGTWALAAKERHILIGGEYGFGWLLDESSATSVVPGARPDL